MKLALQLSCYNGAIYLPTLFASLKQQTHQDWKLYILDNASNESNKALILNALQQSGLPHEYHRVEQNIGFAGAHAYLFDLHKNWSDAVQLLNDDAFLEPTYLETVVAELHKRPTAGSIEGIIYRWDFDHRNDSNGGRTEIVDTLGLRITKSFFCKDIQSGVCVPSIELSTEPISVLGVSGCLPLYRTLAIKEVRADEKLFDPSFVLYKEDVELALRLHVAGYTSWVIPRATAYHRRSYGTHSQKRPLNDASRYSLRNHWWTLWIHYHWKNLFLQPLMLPAEFAKICYWLIRHPAFVRSGLSETWNARAHLFRERSFVQTLRQTKPAKRSPISRDVVDIAVVTVVHNDLNEVYLQSLADTISRTKRTVGVAIVDNGSTKYVANEVVQKFLPNAWTLLRHGDFGYGSSCNLGAELFNAKYIFILNPDTNLNNLTILDDLADYADAHPDVGLIGPKLYYFDGRMQETCRRFPKWFMPFIQRTRLQYSGWGKKYADDFAMRDDDHNTTRDVDWVQGSAMLIPQSVWRTLGGFDHRFFMYFEDTDLCRRTWQRGKRVVYHADISLRHAYHKQSGTYQSFIKNLYYVKEARWHVQSWIKYLWKWNAT